MSVSKTIKRFYFHSFRHRTVVGLAVFIYLLLIIGIAMFYPGEEALTEFIQLMAFLGDFPTNNPGFSLWLIFFCGFSLSLYGPIVGVFLGSNLLPIQERDGKEILFSTPKSLTISLLENSVVVFLLIVLICIPNYLAAIGLLYINNALDAAINLTICFVLVLLYITAITFLTTFGCTINFSKNTGYALGGLYIVFSIIVDLTARQMEELDFLLNFSLFSQAEVVNHSLSATWNEEFILLIVVLVCILIVGSIVLLYRKDFLKKGIQQQTIVEEIEQPEQKKVSSKLSFIRTPIDKLLGRLGWKYPAVRDQLHSNATIFVIFLIFMIFYGFYVISMYVEEEAGALLQSFNMPFIEALLSGNNLADLPANIETFLAFELYSFAWMVIAPFFLILIYDIIMRDYKKRTAEITWTFPKTGSRIFFGRTIAALIYFLIVCVAQIATLFIMEGLLGRISDFTTTITSYLVFVWGYCIIFVFFLSLALLVPSKHALKTLMIGYVFFVLIIFIAFLPGSDLSWLRFLTPFGYFDSISIMLDTRSFIEILPEAIVGTFLTIVFYVVVMKKRIPTMDYLV
jgi:ABC-type transport system involved in multi-copper enzyme maturation permease subunit